MKEMARAQFIKEDREKDLYTECVLLQELDHPQIIGFYGAHRDRRANKVFFLLEYCPKSSLFEFLKATRSLQTPLAKHFTAELVVALEYLRKMEIVHRDLKPGNVVLDKKNHLKLIDFATCKVFNERLLKQINALYS